VGPRTVIVGGVAFAFCVLFKCLVLVPSLGFFRLDTNC